MIKANELESATQVGGRRRVSVEWWVRVRARARVWGEQSEEGPLLQSSAELLGCASLHWSSPLTRSPPPPTHTHPHLPLRRTSTSCRASRGATPRRSGTTWGATGGVRSAGCGVRGEGEGGGGIWGVPVAVGGGVGTCLRPPHPHPPPTHPPARPPTHHHAPCSSSSELLTALCVPAPLVLGPHRPPLPSPPSLQVLHARPGGGLRHHRPCHAAQRQRGN